MVGHQGGNWRGEPFFTLARTDIAMGWTQKPVGDQHARVYVFVALTGVVENGRQGVVGRT